MLATNAVAMVFPLRELLGFDAREFTSQAVLRITVAASELRSAQRAETVLREVANLHASDNTILRIVGDVGRELAARRGSLERERLGRAARERARPGHRRVRVRRRRRTHPHAPEEQRPRERCLPATARGSRLRLPLSAPFDSRGPKRFPRESNAARMRRAVEPGARLTSHPSD